MVLVDRSSSPDARATNPSPLPTSAAKMTRLPVRFEPNVGQMHEDVRFVARKGPSTLLLGDRGATLALHKQKSTPKRGVRDHATLGRKERGERAVVNLSVAGGRAVTPQGSEELVTKSNYFRGNDRSKWRTGVPNYAKVTYPSVLDGVDLVFHGENGALEYDFVVAPGTSVESVAMNVDGDADMELAANGDLVIHTRAGDIVQPKPVVYQRDDHGKKHTIASSYRIVDKNKVGFVVASYDKSRELVIDPLLGFATYLGGSFDEYATTVAADSAGNTYIAGYTASEDFPIRNALDSDFLPGPGDPGESTEAFVAKINPTGTALQWATYFGGSGRETAHAIAVSPTNGDVFVAGETKSGPMSDFPIEPNNAFNTLSGFGQDGFVARFSNDGQTLRYSTLLNGSGDDVAWALAVDVNGNAYVGGDTSSSDFTQFQPFQTLVGNNVVAFTYTGPPVSKGFVVKLNPTGTGALYTHKILGQQGSVSVRGVAIDASLRAYAVGSTNTILSATSGALQDCSGAASTDVFVTRLTTAGATDYLTCLGGNEPDEGAAIAVDVDGNAYVAGFTSSSDFPTTPGAYQATRPAGGGAMNAFVTKLNASGTALVYSTYLGGASFDGAFAIGVDSSRTAWVAGETSSYDFPTRAPIQGGTQLHAISPQPEADAFVTRLNASGSDLLFSTFFGGTASDSAWAIAVRDTGVHITGYTTSTDLPIPPNALQTANAGVTDAFVATVSVPQLLISPPSVQLQINQTQQFAATGGTGFGYVFSVSQNNSGATINPTTGLYVAGSRGGVTDVVTVTDAVGTTANATVVIGTVPSALVISPANTSVPPRGQLQFTASGGLPPYRFTFASNASQGSLTNSGLYTAGSRGSVVDIVRVTDSTGDSRIATITVGPGITINPSAPSTPPNGTITFSATGGSGTGYTWAITRNGSNGATIGATTGTYKAGSGANSVDTVEVTDSLGNKASVQVSVGGGLAISPDSPSTAPRGTIAFSAFGGSGSYTWAMASNPSGGTIDPGTGVYTAGTVGNVIDVVRVTDSVGNGRAVEVTVGPGLAILPANSTVLTGVQINFSGSGGSGTGYVWSIPDNQSGATIDANGLYMSGDSPGTDTVRLTDSFGNTADALVLVQARPTPPPNGQTPGGIGRIDGGTFDGFNIGGGGNDDCSCRAVGTSTGSAGARLIPGLALAVGLVLRRRRR
jgi:hypothetical protein